ncbi:hypothetical protein [Draconibacterium orientale]|uniref:hypothetical protein n=1 Tax=Draconibacterium orientale TaxID=1168034 RepID=UPI002ABE43FD|nr:hypothetical protein [Draconibacterium orientale]
MNRTITKEETEQLFKFCRRQNIVHYDLQVELVDHLASAIEEQWGKWPELSFEFALKRAFKKFGNNGFRRIYESRKKELNKKYTRLHFKYFYSFFRWPQILITFILSYLIFSTIILTENFRVVYTIFFAFTIPAMAYFYLFWFPKKGKLEAKNNTKFLLLEVLNMRCKQFWMVLFLPLNILNFFVLDKSSEGGWEGLSFDDFKMRLFIFGLSFLMVCFGILSYSYSIYASQKIKQHFTEQFPEFVK